MDNFKNHRLQVITAPERNSERKKVKIFLAGTIDNSRSFDWQKELCEKLANKFNFCLNTTIFNPRRKYWNQSPSDDELREQIEWELEHLEEADIIVMNILGTSKSPISLLELGIYINSGKLLVFCPERYYRYMNVDVICNKYDVRLIKSNELEYIIKELDRVLYKILSHQ